MHLLTEKKLTELASVKVYILCSNEHESFCLRGDTFVRQRENSSYEAAHNMDFLLILMLCKKTEVRLSNAPAFANKWT